MINYSDLIGVPFSNRGRNVTTGLDCYGLVMEIYKRFGITLPEFNADWDDSKKISAIINRESSKSAWQKVEPDSLSVPCVMAIRFGVPKGVINHTGVYIGNGKFIHIRERIGVCVDRINSLAWTKQIEGYYKYVGDVNGDSH